MVVGKGKGKGWAGSPTLSLSPELNLTLMFGLPLLPESARLSARDFFKYG
jgi:hypothetical protein